MTTLLGEYATALSMACLIIEFIGEVQWLPITLVHLTVQEMPALADRFKARAESVSLRDQPQLQADMGMAARLIYELISEVLTSRRPGLVRHSGGDNRRRSGL